MERITKADLLAFKEPTPRSLKDLKGSEWLTALSGWLKTFARHYPRAADNPWGPEDLEIYGRGLSELSLADLNRKCESAMKTCGAFAPTIGMILEAPIDLYEAAQKITCIRCGGSGFTDTRDKEGRWLAVPCDHKPQ